VNNPAEEVVVAGVAPRSGPVSRRCDVAGRARTCDGEDGEEHERGAGQAPGRVTVADADDWLDDIDAALEETSWRC
jgi:hypothetical protein